VADHLGVDHGATRRDRHHRGDQLVDVRDPFLEQVSPARSAAGQERADVGGVDVLAEQQHSGSRVVGLAVPGDLDALVGPRRRHPDVGDDDVRPKRVQPFQRRAQVPAAGDHLDALRR
jgi:hypothetical protein